MLVLFVSRKYCETDVIKVSAYQTTQFVPILNGHVVFHKDVTTRGTPQEEAKQTIL